MRLFLASPHTLLKFKGGFAAFEDLLGRGKREAQDHLRREGGREGICRYLRNENISGGRGVWKSESRMEADGEDGDYP